MPFTFHLGGVAVMLGWQDLLGLAVLVTLAVVSLSSLRRGKAQETAPPILPATATPTIDAEKEPKALRYGSGKAEGGAWDATGPGYLPDPDPLHDFDLSTATLRDYVYVNKVLRYPYFQVCLKSYCDGPEGPRALDTCATRMICTGCEMGHSPLLPLYIHARSPHKFPPPLPILLSGMWQVAHRPINVFCARIDGSGGAARASCPNPTGRLKLIGLRCRRWRTSRCTSTTGSRSTRSTSGTSTRKRG